jgi:hypothetical protein
MGGQFDMETTDRHKRQGRMKEEAPRRSFRDMPTVSIPYWIVFVTLVLYGLSTPHPVGVFDKPTPG